MYRTLGVLRRSALLFVAATILAWPAPSLAAKKKPPIPFPIADIFFEFNSTPNDLGVHVSLDAESWNDVRITNPKKQLMIHVAPKGGFRRVGLTELFFEGDEPSLAEVSFKQFLQRVPLGKYTFLGTTTEGRALRSKDALTADIPCPVEVTEPQEDAEVTFDGLVVRWEPAEGIFDPDAGTCNPGTVGLDHYQVIVVALNVQQGFKRELLMDVPPTVTEVLVPAAFLQLAATVSDTVFQIELLAIEDSGNKTITERNFRVAAPAQ